MTLHFLREMDRLNVRLTEVGSKIEAQVSTAYKAFMQLDEAAARRVISVSTVFILSLDMS